MTTKLESAERCIIVNGVIYPKGVLRACIEDNCLTIWEDMERTIPLIDHVPYGSITHVNAGSVFMSASALGDFVKEHFFFRTIMNLSELNNDMGFLVEETDPLSIHNQDSSVQDAGFWILGTGQVENTFTVGNISTGSRYIQFNPDYGSINIHGGSGGWAEGTYFYGAEGTPYGGFGALGTNDGLSWYWMGKAYNDAGVYVLQENNYVGIGTASPSYPLDVNGVIRASENIISNYGGSALSSSSFYQGNFTAFIDGTQYISGARAGYGFWNNTYIGLYLYAANDEKLRIKTSSNADRVLASEEWVNSNISGTSGYIPVFTGTNTIGNSSVQQPTAGVLSIGTSRLIELNSNTGGVYISGNAGGWATEYGFKGSAATDLGGFGSYGNADTMNYLWIGSGYSNETVKFFPDKHVEFSDYVKVNGQVVVTDSSLQNVLSYYSGSGLIGTLTNHPVQIWTNSTPRVTIDASGHVSIGQSDAHNYRLNVKLDSTTNVAFSEPTTDVGAMVFIDSGATVFKNGRIYGNNLGFHTGAGGTENVIIDSSGNVKLSQYSGTGNRLAIFDADGTFVRSSIDSASVLTAIPTFEQVLTSGRDYTAHSYGTSGTPAYDPIFDYGDSGAVAWIKGTNRYQNNTGTGLAFFTNTTTGANTSVRSLELLPNGDIQIPNLSGSGSVLTYSDNNGTLQKSSIDPANVVVSSTLAGYVPYTGATGNVILGSYQLSADIVGSNVFVGLSTGNYISITNDVSLYSSSGADAIPINTGGVLASDNYLDSALVPSNGIYSKGDIVSSSGVVVNNPTDPAFILKQSGTIKAAIEHAGGVTNILDFDGQIDFYVGGNNPSNRTMSLLNNKVGIGLSNPQEILSVLNPLSGSIGDEYPIIVSQIVSGAIVGGIYSTWEASSPYGGGLCFKTYHANVGLEENMRLTNVGYLGIGISAPSTKLHVKTTSSDNFILSDATGGSSKSGYAMANAGVTYGSTYFDNATNNVCLLHNYIAGSLILGTNSAEKLRIDIDGKVGIATSSPTAQLDVDGNIRSRYLSGAGDKLLYTDNDGNIESTGIGIDDVFLTPTGLTNDRLIAWATTEMRDSLIGDDGSATITAYGRFYPDANNTRNIGSASLRWATGYFNSLNAPATTYTSGGYNLLVHNTTTDAFEKISSLDIAHGGTGLTSAGTSGQVLISNGSSWVLTNPPWLSSIPTLQGIIDTNASATMDLSISSLDFSVKNIANRYLLIDPVNDNITAIGDYDQATGRCAYISDNNNAFNNVTGTTVVSGDQVVPTTSNAMLEVQSVNKGFLPPRFENISSVTGWGSDEEGMIVYDRNTKGWYGWDGGAWVQF